MLYAGNAIDQFGVRAHPQPTIGPRPNRKHLLRRINWPMVGWILALAAFIVLSGWSV